MKSQFITRLPIPDMDEATRGQLGQLALTITELARRRYALHGRTRHRLQSDLGTPDRALNTKLTAWWDLDFRTLRAELQKVYKNDIPLRARDEWEEWFIDRRTQHDLLTTEIVTHETALNALVYTLFDLTPEEIALIEESTKYLYGSS